MWVSLAAVGGVSYLAPFPFSAPSLRMSQLLLAQTFSFRCELSVLRSLLLQTFSEPDLQGLGGGRVSSSIRVMIRGPGWPEILRLLRVEKTQPSTFY